MIKVGILDYGMGNLRSIGNAVSYLGFSAELCLKEEHLKNVSHLIIPGVGSYKKAMINLSELHLVDPIRCFARSGRPLLGICLGMQLMSTTGNEPEPTDGLNLIPGEVVPIPEKSGLQVPHVGWNNIELTNSHPLWQGIKPGLDWYFVHSFHFVPASRKSQIGTSFYGNPLAAVVGQKNIIGTQFHPEKSQEHGLRLLQNFLQWDGQC